MIAAQGTERDWSTYPETNPFFSAETSDAEAFARMLLEDQDDGETN